MTVTGSGPPGTRGPDPGRNVNNPFTMDLKLMADEVAESYRRAGFQTWTQEFFYPTDRVVMSGSPSQPSRQQIRFESDAFFCYLGNLCDIRTAGNFLGYAPTIGVQVQDADSGYFFSDMNFQQIPAQLHSGMPGTPWQFAYPYIFPPGGRATVTLRTLNTGTLGTIIFTLWGIKVYTRPYSRDVRQPDHW